MHQGGVYTLQGRYTRRCHMILNDTLQKHQECLEQCDMKRTACEREHENDTTCDTETEICERDCDFDYGP